MGSEMCIRDSHDAQAEHTADEAEDHADDAAALFRFFLFVRCGCAGLAGGTCGGLYALGGDMALLLGFYGNRLLWSVSKRTAKAVTQNRTML